MLEGDRLRVRVNCEILHKILSSGADFSASTAATGSGNATGASSSSSSSSPQKGGGGDAGNSGNATNNPIARVAASANTLRRSMSSTQLASLISSGDLSATAPFSSTAPSSSSSQAGGADSTSAATTSAGDVDESIEEVVVPGGSQDRSGGVHWIAAAEVFKLLYTRSGYNSFKRWVRNGGFSPTTKEGMTLLTAEPSSGASSASFPVDESSFVRALRATTDMSDVESLDLYETLSQRKPEVTASELFLVISGLVASESCQLTMYLYLHSRELFDAFGGHRSSITFDQLCTLAQMIGLGPSYVLEQLAPYKVTSNNIGPTGEENTFGYDEFVMYYFIIFSDWDARPLPTGLVTSSPFGRPGTSTSQPIERKEPQATSVAEKDTSVVSSRFCVIS